MVQQLDHHRCKWCNTFSTSRSCTCSHQSVDPRQPWKADLYRLTPSCVCHQKVNSRQLWRIFIVYRQKSVGFLQSWRTDIVYRQKSAGFLQSWRTDIVYRQKSVAFLQSWRTDIGYRQKSVAFLQSWRNDIVYRQKSVAFLQSWRTDIVYRQKSVGFLQAWRTFMEMLGSMECFSSTYIQDSGIEPVLRRCSPSDGMCYSSLSTVKDSSTVQLGCWPGPDAHDGVTVLYAGAQCLHEAHRLLCLCTGHLCNPNPPEFDEGSPEGTDWHGAIVLGYVVVALVVLVGFMFLLWRECRATNDSGLVRNIEEVQSTKNVSGRTNVSCIEDNGVFSITRGPKAKSYVPKTQPTNVKRIVNDLYAV